MKRKKKQKEDKKPKHACLRTFTITKWIFYLAWASALGYTLFNISKSLEKFLSKPVSTKISVYHNEDGTMQFPTISLCNLNRVNSSYLSRDPVHQRVWRIVDTNAPEEIDWSDPPTAKLGDMFYQDFLKKSPSWEQTLLFCAYAGVRRCSDLPVFKDLSNMVEEELAPTGKCYRFNPKGLLHSKAGDYGSVYLRLNINLREYMDKSSNGFVMAMHHHSQYSSTRNTGIVMSPGFKYRINIKTLERTELPVEDGGKCNSSNSYNSYGSYDLESCHTECRDRDLNKACGCIPVLPPNNIHGYRACTLKEMYECGNNAYLNFVLEESDTEHGKEHSCDCWVPCKHYSYELSTATTAISREYAETKATGSEGKRLNFTTEDVLKNNIILEAHFRDMYVQEISQVPEYSFWNLLADVGGMLGLFLGASVFTIIDFIRYAINYSYKEYKSRFRDESPAKSKQKASKPKNNESSNGSRDKRIAPVYSGSRKKKTKVQLSPQAEKSRASSSDSEEISPDRKGLCEGSTSASALNGQNNVLKLI
ncbi:hypothetical protein ACHWQZ_G016710 [Mnemiopsis leidyi]